MILAVILSCLFSLGIGLAVAFYLQKQIPKTSQLDPTDPALKNILSGLGLEIVQKTQGSLVESAKNQLRAEAELQKKEVELLVKPLAENLEKYQKNLAHNEAQRNREMGSLDNMLKTLLESNVKLKSETTNLVHALKRPTVRGRWGEVQLRRVVELSGMSAHCDFSEQTSTDSDEGRLRPDLIVNLPGQRQIVVDSKAVLSGYLEAEEALEEVARKSALTRHSLSLKTRIQDLSRKNYWEQFKQAPEFVVLFIPGEAFFSAAIECDPTLVEYGFEQRVILSTPTTLMALLRAVAYGWRQEQMAENSKKISEQATKVYQSLAVWTQHFSTMGGALDRATKAFNSAVGSFDRTVMPPLRKFKELGVSSKDEITQLELIETALRSTSNKDFEEGGNV